MVDSEVEIGEQAVETCVGDVGAVEEGEEVKDADCREEVGVALRMLVYGL